MEAAHTQTTTNGAGSINARGLGYLSPSTESHKQQISSKVWKGKDGFEAETVFVLDASIHRVLIVTTWKTHGGMRNQFCVQVDKGDGFKAWDVYGDYRQSSVFKGTRCTEKTVRELHAQALSVVDHHLNQAAAHYANKSADRAECV